MLTIKDIQETLISLQEEIESDFSNLSEDYIREMKRKVDAYRLLLKIRLAIDDCDGSDK